MNVAFVVAALISTFTWGLHTFVGSPQIARPLLESELPPVPRYTNYYCWHIVTLVLAAMSLGFGYAAVRPEGWDVAVGLTVLSLAFAVWSLVLVFTSRRSPWELPQWTLFFGVSAAGLVGVLG
ncbi:MAG: hypothetical protein KTR31_39065 [Myxococcales bacterium]|nr:hypothetical protein [Myxococcales bacterium]